MIHNKTHSRINNLLKIWQEYLSKLSMADTHQSERLFSIETKWLSCDLTKDVPASEETCVYIISYYGKYSKVPDRDANTYEEALIEMVHLILDVMSERLEIVTNKPTEQLEEADYFVINNFKQAIKENLYDY